MRRDRLFLGLALLALTQGGCDAILGIPDPTALPDGTGGDSTGPDTGGGGSAGGGDGGGPLLACADLPGNAGEDGIVLAVHTLHLGDIGSSGAVSSDAWMEYGFDLDGRMSTKDSTDLCKPAAGAKASAVYLDGHDGIDNSFGKNILPILTSLASDASAQENAAIADGQFTVLLRIQGLEPGAAGSFDAQLFTGAIPEGAPPAWQGGDVWSVQSDSLQGGDLAHPVAALPGSQLTVDPSGARVWQTGCLGAELRLSLMLGGLPVVILPIQHVRISMLLSEDNTHATSGRIGGILDSEQLISELAKWVGAFDPTLCPPSTTFESIAQQIRQGSDILVNGTQDPARTCNAISIGLGFEADAALLGAVFTPPIPMDPCSI